MKRVLVLIFLVLTTFSISSCSFFDKESFHTYGVVVNESIGDNLEPQIMINTIEYGYMTLPSSKNTYVMNEGSYNNDYVYQVGDLVEIYFNDISKVEVLESYPSQFGKNPDSIKIWKQDTYLLKNDEYYSFKFPIDSVSYDYEFDINSKNIGDMIDFWYSEITDGVPKEVKCCSVEISYLDQEYIEVLLHKDFVLDILSYYAADTLVIFDYDESSLE